MARKRAMEERAQQEKLRRMQAEQEQRLAKNRSAQDAAKQLEVAKKQQAEKEKQAMAERYRREEAERKLVQEKKDRESREQALAIERKKQEEDERKASKLSESKRIEKEKQLAIERKRQEEQQRQLALEKKKQDEKAQQLLAEKQRQEEYQRQLTEDKKQQEREQARLSYNTPYGNPRYVKSNGEKDPSSSSPKSISDNGNLASTIESGSKPTVRTLERDDYKFSLTPQELALTNSFEANRGKLPWPVEKGYVSEHFGKNKHPLFNVVTENYGVDIKTSVGAAARAIYSGEVNSIINVPGMGQTVLINHGSFYTVYSKLSKVNVVKGSRVNTKQSIGIVSTDDDGNTLIHFEIWKVGANGSPYKVNPEQWVAQ